jgi:hypothetical protein
MNQEAEALHTSSLELTHRLHIVQAHNFHYSTLLQSFKKAVQFVMNTPNPALTKEQRDVSERLLERECNKLQKEVERLDRARGIQEERLKNVMHLVGILPDMASRMLIP